MDEQKLAAFVAYLDRNRDRIRRGEITPLHPKTGATTEAAEGGSMPSLYDNPQYVAHLLTEIADRIDTLDDPDLVNLLGDDSFTLRGLAQYLARPTAAAT